MRNISNLSGVCFKENFGIATLLKVSMKASV